MLKALAQGLIQAKLDTSAGRPVSVKLSIPVDGSVEQAKFLKVVEKISSREQRLGGIIIEKSSESTRALDDFLEALTELVGPDVVDEALIELRQKRLQEQFAAQPLSKNQV